LKEDPMADDKRDKIVQAARQRFRYYGIKKTTVREVAQDAGVAVGTLYLYFKDKDDLVVACAEDFVSRHRQKAEEIIASKASVEKKLRQYLVSRFREAEDTRTSSRHAVELTREVFRLKPDRLREEGAMMRENLVRLLQHGVQSGEFHVDDLERDATVLLYSIAYFFPHALSSLPSPPQEEDLLLVVNWFLEVWKGRNKES
jgi:AcrR family transcriptional regulator